MITTYDFDQVVGRWRFRIRDRNNEMIEYDSQYVYLHEIDADEAAHDALDFSTHRALMEL